MPDWQEWIDPERSQPITPGVDVMGNERNTLRQFVEDDRPRALGVHVIGDARCQTDSLFAWGVQWRGWGLAPELQTLRETMIRNLGLKPQDVRVISIERKAFPTRDWM